jgi:hypothetical protein
VSPLPSESAAYRALVRAQMIDPNLRDRRSRKWKRWERGAPMELWHGRRGWVSVSRWHVGQGVDRGR